MPLKMFLDFKKRIIKTGLMIKTVFFLAYSSDYIKHIDCGWRTEATSTGPMTTNPSGKLSGPDFVR
jgi:hypothetical protein